MFLLELESLPKEKEATAAGQKTVQVERLEAEREFSLARKAFEKNDSRTAVVHLEKAVRLAPNYLDALLLLGIEYVKSGRYDMAEPILEKARVLAPKDINIRINLGVVYFRLGENSAANETAEKYYRRAAHVLEEALRLDPKVAITSFYLGTVLYKAGRYRAAEALLLNALVLDGQMHDARLALLNVYLRQQRYMEASKQISYLARSNVSAEQRRQIERVAIEIESALARGEERKP